MERSERYTLEESRLLQQNKRGLLQILFSRSALVVVLLLANFALMFWITNKLLQFLPLLFGGVTIFTLGMLLIIINGRSDASIKLTWCALIAILPLPGTILYLFAKFNTGVRLSKKALRASVCACNAYLPAPPQDSAATPPISEYLYRHAGAATYPGNQTKYFPLGDDMFQEMLIQLENAEKYIFLEYFIIVPGHMWGEILKVLHRKAKEGVEVKLMYDGTNAVANLPVDYPRQMEKLGIQCKVFSPVRPFLSTHYNNRDHRKILVIDGNVAFTGGINLQDRYINREQVFGHWKDTGIMVSGPAAQGFALLFLQLWNAGEENLCLEPYAQIPPALAESGYVIPFGDIPTDAQQVGKQVYLHILNQAKRYVYIMTPYLILDDEMENALKFAARRGVDVRLILPHIPDKVTVFALAKGHYRALKEAGVRIFEYTPGFVHAKAFLSDDLCGVVGTINLDYRSLYHHYECGAYLYQVQALRELADDFAETFPKCQEITLEQALHLPLGYRIGGMLLKALAPLL